MRFKGSLHDNVEVRGIALSLVKGYKNVICRYFLKVHFISFLS